MARNGKSQQPAGTAPRLRRAYYECRYGQLHLHNAIPAGGGFDELTPVICIHAPGETGRVFMPVLSALGVARSVYAPDLPGAGESDPAPGETALDSAVQAIGDFVDSMRIRMFDLIARGASASVAQRLLEARGQAVRRVVVLGAEGQRGGPRIAWLSSAEAAIPQLTSRLIELLRAGP